MKDVTEFMSICLFVLMVCTASSIRAASSDEPAGVETAQPPCYIKIAPGGELRVKIDTDRKAELFIKKAADESEVAVTAYRNGP